MSEKWTWVGEPNNIHVVQADDLNMRVCFLTSNGPTVRRANLIAAAPALAEAAEPFVKLALHFGEHLPDDHVACGTFGCVITVGHLRALAAALKAAKGE